MGIPDLVGGFLHQRDCPGMRGWVLAVGLPSGKLYGYEPTPCFPRSHIRSTGFTSRMPCGRSCDNSIVPNPRTILPALKDGICRANWIK